jgi:putative membrane protein insertion efficiency factor
MRDSLARILWIVGAPLRVALVWLLRGYRATLGQVMGGRCRFYPSCSEYAEAAVSQVGVVRGVPLTVWRVLRCSPLSKGGVDYPPVDPRSVAKAARPGRPAPLYDNDIQRRGGLRARRRVAS